MRESSFRTYAVAVLGLTEDQARGLWALADGDADRAVEIYLEHVA